MDWNFTLEEPPKQVTLYDEGIVVFSRVQNALGFPLGRSNVEQCVFGELWWNNFELVCKTEKFEARWVELGVNVTHYVFPSRLMVLF